MLNLEDTEKLQCYVENRKEAWKIKKLIFLEHVNLKDFETHKVYIQNAHAQYSFIPQVLSNRFVSIDGDVFITFSPKSIHSACPAFTKIYHPTAAVWLHWPPLCEGSSSHLCNQVPR